MILKVDNKDFIINGMNWDYYPIGTNYSYNLWNQSDDFIKKALDYEMSFLQDMGVNAIRQYTGVPAKWITYIYKNYGIYTMLNHSFGRYGIKIGNQDFPKTDYSDERVQKQLLDEVTNMVKDYRNTPGLLLFLLGNENNYGLFWEGSETEDIPVPEDEESLETARTLYKFFNKAIVEMKKLDANHPMAICNGDTQFLDIIAEECKDIDIFGTNSYRGATFTNLFEEVQQKLNKPVMFTEFGADAYNILTQSEDQKSQAYYMVRNWEDIYLNTAGKGKFGNSIGGFTFQFSDGWWKFGQTKNLDVHDTNASWRNDGYSVDASKNENNMNEEWFGVMAKGPVDNNGHYPLYPRAAYYAITKAHHINPYQKGVTDDVIKKHFKNINIDEAFLKAQKK